LFLIVNCFNTAIDVNNYVNNMRKSEKLLKTNMIKTLEKTIYEIHPENNKLLLKTNEIF
jgi:hypothetical protein